MDKKKRKKMTPKTQKISKEPQSIHYQIDGKVILRQIQELAKERQMKI